jgi:hypothetical protein
MKIQMVVKSCRRLPFQKNRLLLGLWVEVKVDTAEWSGAVVPKLWSADPKGCTTISKGIRGHISVMSASKFTYF